MDWFSPARLAAFKGNTQLKASHLPQARATLTQALDDRLYDHLYDHLYDWGTTVSALQR